MGIEKWLSVVSYNGLYEVSSFGNVRSLLKLSTDGRILKPKDLRLNRTSDGYFSVKLTKCGKLKTIKVHQLVAQSFLNHIVCGHKLVINHKDFNRANNNVDNLEIITPRENGNQKHMKSSSKYVGVEKCNKKWRARIYVNGRKKHLGYFFNEKEASNAYQEELKQIGSM